MTKRFILTCMMGLAMLGAPLSVNAQKTKVISRFIQKIKPKSVKPLPKPKSKPQYVYVTCYSCKGKGTKSVWNSQFEYYEQKKCSSCFGTGKKLQRIK